MGIDVNIEVWRKNTWWHRLHLLLQDITNLIPLAEIFILVDEEQLGFSETISGRHRIPFLEKDGHYWGAPPDNETAIRELERLRQSGANFIVFAWTAFWWLDFYSEFHYYLRTKFRRVMENERLVIFDLRL
jgi:hypothetical protein